LVIAVPLSRFTSRVGGGSAFFVRRHSHVYEKARTYFPLDSDGCRLLFSPTIASLIMSLIAFLLMGVGMLGRGLLMWKQKKRGWQPWVIVGIVLLVAALFGYI